MTNDIDMPGERYDHVFMNAASDKEYIDAKLETTDTRVEGKLSVLAATVDTQFAGVDAKFAGVDAKFAGVDAKFAAVDAKFAAVDARFAELRAEMQKGFAELTKWMVGTVIAVNAVSVTVLMFAINNAAHKAAAPPAPIIIYTQPPAVPHVSAPAAVNPK